MSWIPWLYSNQSKKSDGLKSSFYFYYYFIILATETIKLFVLKEKSLIIQWNDNYGGQLGEPKKKRSDVTTFTSKPENFHFKK